MPYTGTVQRFTSPVLFVALTALALGVSFAFGKPTIFGISLVTLLTLRFFAATYFSERSKKKDYAPFAGKITVSIPFYNEDPDALEACVRSVLASTRLPETISIVDDGSSDGGAARARMAELLPIAWNLGVNMYVQTQPQNMGKREGLAVAFEDDADVYVCVDSDTVLDPYAIERATRPLSDPTVSATTGVVLARNATKNILTRLIDLRYANAFLFERASYSAFGSVLCCCGSLAVYRGEVVRANVEDFLTQRFLGAPAVAGDDRRLTNYCLQKGQVLLVEDARAETLVPEKFGHYLRQQVRWNKSFFRESLWVLKNFSPKTAPFLLSFVEMFTWLVLTASLAVVLFIRPAFTASIGLAATYLVFVIVMAYARSVRYFDARNHGREYLWGFALAPLYGFLHIFVLLPLRLYALATLRRAKWGTRSVVEVTAT